MMMSNKVSCGTRGNTRNRYKILIRKPEMKRPLVESGMDVMMIRVLLLQKGCDM
jgi:hypothetical protein